MKMELEKRFFFQNREKINENSRRKDVIPDKLK
jgi:hypothetical protein